MSSFVESGNNILGYPFPFGGPSLTCLVASAPGDDVGLDVDKVESNQDFWVSVAMLRAKHGCLEVSVKMLRRCLLAAIVDDRRASITGRSMESRPGTVGLKKNDKRVIYQQRPQRLQGPRIIPINA